MESECLNQRRGISGSERGGNQESLNEMLPQPQHTQKQDTIDSTDKRSLFEASAADIPTEYAIPGFGRLFGVTIEELIAAGSAGDGLASGETYVEHLLIGAGASQSKSGIHAGSNAIRASAAVAQHADGKLPVRVDGEWEFFRRSEDCDNSPISRGQARNISSAGSAVNASNICSKVGANAKMSGPMQRQRTVRFDEVTVLEVQHLVDDTDSSDELDSPLPNCSEVNEGDGENNSTCVFRALNELAEQRHERRSITPRRTSEGQKLFVLPKMISSTLWQRRSSIPTLPASD
eukprot:CAMPEP_0180637610 /NCGR_PEP_ID=MMETSP1037_2-20121125/43772_1 /TAXON_ID=632150 /ORGANISM="Azadinium spinosum, Strain 3D9" /LENGTH=290 /DNA_ID=CAMNT_0022658861 /DNA_START=58 /DNA_END=927 /DNA_ORIENTATION=-